MRRSDDLGGGNAFSALRTERRAMPLCTLVHLLLAAGHSGDYRETTKEAVAGGTGQIGNRGATT